MKQRVRKSLRDYNRELSLCPHCKSKAHIVTSRGEDYCLTGVQCDKCGEYLETREDTWGYYYEDAVAEWNEHCKEVATST